MSPIPTEILDKIFKAYDIRGTYPEQLSEEFYTLLGKAYVTHFKPKTVVVGHDIRPESIQFKEALIEGLLNSGCNVVDLGEIPTEMIYFAVGEFNNEYDGGLVVTASHNPAGWNGCKFVDKNVMAIGTSTGSLKIKEIIVNEAFLETNYRGKRTSRDLYPEYKLKIRTFLGNIPSDKNISAIVDAGNGIGGKVFDYVFGDIENLKVEKMYFEPDGTYPNHVPNPLEEENVAELKENVLSSEVDIGIAIDGDADRTMFIDKKGRRPDGVYTGVLFTRFLLRGTKNQVIIHDPRVTWPFEKEAKTFNAKTVTSVAGHAPFKMSMKENGGLFGAELSAHYFYKDFYNADSGLITAAIMLRMLFEGLDLEKELDYLYEKYPNSGEVNYEVDNQQALFDKFEGIYKPQGAKISHIDGISIEFDTWRFNIRGSNTQSVVRLNLEGITKKVIVEKFAEVEKVINAPRINLPALKELL